VPKDHPQVDRYAQNPPNELLVIELRVVSRLHVDEDIELLRQASEDAEAKSEVRAPKTERCDIGHFVLGDTLSTPGTVTRIEIQLRRPKNVKRLTK